MTVLAFDFGGSTGRALLGELKHGKLVYNELYRFDNIPIERDGHMCWDFDTLWANVKKCLALAPDIDSIGIDTWGVDYGLTSKDGELIGNLIHYRDSRVNDTYDRLMARYGYSLYLRTGIQTMKINTMFQLCSDDRLLEADKMLFIPDLFAYMLTGAKYSEYSIATTSGLVDMFTRDWNWELIDELGLPRHIFAPIIMNGMSYGKVKSELARELGLREGIEVVAVCTHDTASAVCAMATSPSDSIFISSGTWSLLGVEQKAIDITNTSFTNEGGYGGNTTYLSNIVGLWLMQEMRRKVQREMPEHKVTFADLEAMMDGTEVGKYIIDTNDDVFVAPDDMEDAIKAYVKDKYGASITRGEVIRCIYDSLAYTYSERVAELNARYGNRYKCINILGGGSQAGALAQRTRELAGLKVVTGPIEATAIGNMLVQLIYLGEIKNLDEAHAIVAHSENVGVYQ